MVKNVLMINILIMMTMMLIKQGVIWGDGRGVLISGIFAAVTTSTTDPQVNAANPTEAVESSSTDATSKEPVKSATADNLTSPVTPAPLTSAIQKDSTTATSSSPSTSSSQPCDEPSSQKKNEFFWSNGSPHTSGYATLMKISCTVISVLNTTRPVHPCAKWISAQTSKTALLLAMFPARTTRLVSVFQLCSEICRKVKKRSIASRTKLHWCFLKQLTGWYRRESLCPNSIHSQAFWQRLVSQISSLCSKNQSLIAHSGQPQNC